MSNSKLVCYTKISPNKTSPRRNTIKKITIHHMAGNLSIETCGNVFAPSSRQASSNYGIGTDGRIGMYVEEKDRAWTSSNSDNDNQAVTIEVANDQIGGNWHVSDKAMESLINLCVDICQRNNIKSLNFTGNKNGNLTMHKYFAATACPGPYLESKFPYIAQEVNKRLSGSTSSSSTTTVKPEAVSDVESTIWNYFKAKGFSDCGIAGLMGNLYAESGLKATNLQNTYESKLGYTDDTYTTAVDNGSYTNFVKDSAGYGLAQWTFWSRKQGLLNLAQSQKKSVGSLSLQLDYLYKELSESFKTVLNTLKTATTILQASNAVLLDFERPANQSQSVQTQRASYGQKYYDKFAKSTSTGSGASSTKLAEGDEVYFSGNTHYTSASASTGKACTSGTAKITKTYNGKHPYHIVGSNGCNAYGWVDEQYLTKESGTCTANLNLREGTTTSTKSLGIMKKNSKVFILETASNGWYKVYSVDLKKVGYCSNSYISK